MKNSIILLALIALFSFGCEKEMITPEAQNEAVFSLAGQEGHHRPATQCGPSTFSDLKDGNGIVRGTIETFNAGDEMYILVDMQFGWMVSNSKLFMGESADIPKGNGGRIEVEEFPMMFNHSQPVGKYTYTFAIGNMPACYDVFFTGVAKRLNFFGNTVETQTIWADGTALSDGYYFSFCKGACGAAPTFAGQVD